MGILIDRSPLFLSGHATHYFLSTIEHMWYLKLNGGPELLHFGCVM